MKNHLQEVIEKMIIRFNENHMKVNCDKFQMILFGKDKCITEQSIEVGNHVIKSRDTVKLLGVHFDRV